MARLVEGTGGLRERIGQYFKGEAPLEPGSVGWEARHEINKLGGKIDHLTASLSKGNLSPSERTRIEGEITSLKGDVDRYRTLLNQADRNGRGFIAADSSATALAKERGYPTGDELPPHHYWRSRTNESGETDLFLQRTDAAQIDLHRYNDKTKKFEIVPGTRVLPENADILLKNGPYRVPDFDEIGNLNVNGTHAKRIRQGTNGRIAVIGRNMYGKGGVIEYTNSLNALGYDTHLFADVFISPASRQEWKDLKRLHAGPNGLIPQNKLFGTLGYRENMAWAQKMIDEGYTVVDIGNPNNDGFSVYYAAEKRIIFGDGNAK